MIKLPKEKENIIKLLKAFVAFENSEHGKTILSFLESEKQRLQDKNDKEDEEALFRRIQGANQVLNKIIKTSKEARSEVNKLL